MALLWLLRRFTICQYSAVLWLQEWWYVQWGGYLIPTSRSTASPLSLPTQGNCWCGLPWYISALEFTSLYAKVRTKLIVAVANACPWIERIWLSSLVIYQVRCKTSHCLHLRKLEALICLISEIPHFFIDDFSSFHFQQGVVTSWVFILHIFLKEEIHIQSFL